MKLYYSFSCYVCILIYAGIYVDVTLGLDNGLARTPPMGWLSWERFACNIDCKDYPNDCINERLYMEMADRLASDGYSQVGYDYINIDDCWSEMARDPVTNRLVADKQRFPSGIKALADYIHSKGLKLGIYGDCGTKTCGGYPGSLISNTSDYYSLDAKTFAEWKVDSFKFDGCYADVSEMPVLYPKMELALNSTNRAMLYSCSWPAYIIGQNPDYGTIAKFCNLWRNFDDIEDSWQSVTSIIEFYAKYQDVLAKYNKPGQWNDPDMLIIGNFGLSLGQSEAQMAIWAIWSAPLYMSNDLRQIKKEHRDILLNKHVIAVNQDELGIFGKIVVNDTKANAHVFVKPMTPVINGSYSYAIVYLNQRTLGPAKVMTYKLSTLIPQLSENTIYQVHDLFDQSRIIGKLDRAQNLTLKVNGSGSVRMVKIVPTFQSIYQDNYE